MFDRFPSDPPPPRKDTKNRCLVCETALTADDVRCPKCNEPNPKRHEIRMRQKIIRERRMKRLANADIEARSRLQPKGKRP